MRGTAMLAIIGAIWLLTGLCWTTVALGGDVPMLGHGLPIPAPQRSRDLGPPLRLPVRMVRYIPLRPAVGGEIFHTVSFLLDYTGGPITLAADAGGTRHTIVDDQLTLRVTHPDGTTSEYQDELESKWHAPMDLSEHFRTGVNRVDVELSDYYGDVMSSTDLWLTAETPKPAQLPLVLFEGAQPQSYWPAQEAVVEVNGPDPGWRVMLSGDQRGRGGTWAACALEIRVSHGDGSVHTVSYQYCSTLESVPTGTEQGSTDGPVQMRAPADVISLFGPGTNHAEAFILDGRGGLVASSPV